MRELIERVIELAIQIQQIPAPTFQEEKRAEFIRNLFLKEGLQDVCIDEAGNAFAHLSGTGAEKPLIVSAHMDTVFPLETDLRVQPRRRVDPWTRAWRQLPGRCGVVWLVLVSTGTGHPIARRYLVRGERRRRRSR